MFLTNQANFPSRYWRASVISKNIIQCQVPAYCIGGVGRGNGSALASVDYCYPNHLGPECLICEPGFVRRGQSFCSPCNSNAVSADQLRVVGLLALAVVLVLLAACLIQVYFCALFSYPLPFF